MIQQKLGTCKHCGFPRPVNSREECSDCVFKINHNGMSQLEVHLEKLRGKEKAWPIRYINNLPNTTKKSRKTMVNDLMKDVRSEKRREQISKDEETYEQVFNLNPNECEECGVELPDFFRDDEGKVAARFQYSHILSKGAHCEYRNCSWNFQRLCFNCHQNYEFGNRKLMKTYLKSKLKVINFTGLDLL